MEWIKASIQTTTLGTEIVTGVLISSGITGVEVIDPIERARHLEGITRTWDYVDESLLENKIDETQVIFYVTKDEAGITMLEKIKLALATLTNDANESDIALPVGISESELSNDSRSYYKKINGIGTLEIRTENTNDENWLHEWKKHFKPMHVGTITVVPEWEDYIPKSSREIIFKIDPGSAFGTGQHQTTQLCITTLQKWIRSNDTFLDIGCGSGILSIIGVLLGASYVFACDIDPAGAISATKRNAALNSIDENILQVQAGDVLCCEESGETLRKEICKQKYNIVTANIVADVIVELIPFVTTVLKPGGIFIASGIIDERVDEVIAAFAKGGFSIVEQLSLEGWRCIVGRVCNA